MIIRRFINWQVTISKAFDRWLPRSYRIDGQTEFRNVTVPRFIKREITICDVGGGKRPYVSAELKQQLALTTIGVDIDERELASAPDEVYSETICADITRYRGKGNVDLVICQAVLEHVPNVDQALEAIHSILKPGGVALIFLPCRNAVFARLNLVLPQSLKRKLLFAINPHSRSICGFRSFYDRCTPAWIGRLAEQRHLEIVETHSYFCSSYFAFFFPLHLTWRVWGVLSRVLLGDEAAESFSIILRRPCADAQIAKSGQNHQA